MRKIIIHMLPSGNLIGSFQNEFMSTGNFCHTAIAHSVPELKHWCNGHYGSCSFEVSEYAKNKGVQK